MFSWRRFQFFDKEQVLEPGTDVPPKCLENVIVTCASAGRGTLIFGDSEGFLNLVESRDFSNNFTRSFQAYQRTVTHILQLRSINIIATVGDDAEAIDPTVRIWNMDKIDKASGSPQCMKALKLRGLPQIVPVTAFAVREDLTEMAVGLCNGTVVLFRGDLARPEKSTKQVLLEVDAAGNPVTGLGFKEQFLSPQQQQQQQLSGESIGGNVGNKTRVLFVVTSGSVSVYYTHSKEFYKEVLEDAFGCGVGCAAMSEGGDMIVARKEAVYFYETEGRGPCFAFEGEKKLVTWFRSYLVVVGEDSSNLKFNTFNIYDLKNKFIAFSETRFQNVTQVVAEWGSIFILTGEGKVFQLVERDTQTKLETLFKKNLYSVAVNLAHSQQYDHASIIDIFRRYGDHLYGKGDFDAAMTQYLCTIGHLEPSYVIRKFLDAQRIHNLTSYLQALHERGLATADHTTLLFNCYTKLKDVDKLDNFIKTDSELNFEIETAIKACRQAGYFSHALYLAKKHNEYDSTTKILLEDQQAFTEALEYIDTLDFFEAEKTLKKYGKSLLTHLPEQTTSLLMKLCSGDDSRKSSAKAVPDEFVHIFVDQPSWLLSFLEFIVEHEKGSASQLVYNTLLELYLRDKENHGAHALQLLSSLASKFEDDHALMLCKIHDFRDGLLYLYEHMHLYNEIVQYYCEKNEHEGLIQACKKYGDKEPKLWVEALSYFAHKEEECQAEIEEVLSNIDRDNLLPPLLVVQILSEKPTATLSLVKDYITRRLQQENELIRENTRVIRHYVEETKKMRAEIEELRTSARIFMLNKCTHCLGSLDLPAVHFLCKHSFHQRCLPENENECPNCAPDNKKILEIKRSLEENKDQHEQFFKQLEGSADGFSTVSDYFGRGIFSATPASFEM